MDRPNFTARLPAAEPPAVDAFLSAVDHAMNSNAFLLTAMCDVPVTAGNRQDVLHAFLRSPLFEPLIRDADSRRGWYNLADWGDDRPWERPLVRAGSCATVSPLDHAGFLARLRWMLCEAFTPYDHHYSAQEAEPLVQGFAREVLGGEGPTWSFADVGPDFLRSTEYYVSQEPPPKPVYFDGGDSDTATFIHRDRTVHLLLTNGSP